ncbi:MAG: extracellular solute-binding protein [Bacilli bacterium]|jgi:ABC-type glycerol-3-phosphate transport system substrate-binding protein|nr:extracellular solute-binding protein [Bacilli bacterium]
MSGEEKNNPSAKKSNRFLSFFKKHKKGTAWSVVGVILLVLVAVLAVPKQTAYDNDFAYQSYQARRNDAFSQGCHPETSDGTVPVDTLGYTGPKVYQVTNGKKVTYTLTCEKTQTVALTLDVALLHNGFHDSEVSVLINGQDVLDRVKLRALWKSSSATFKTDSYGNEIVPSQTKVEGWQSLALYDESYASPLPYEFTLQAGSNAVELDVTDSGDFLVGDLTMENPQTILSYQEYESQYQGKAKGVRLDDIQGEHFTTKNDTQPIPTYESDVNAAPYDTNHNRLNTLSNFSASSEMVTYTFAAETEGLYQMTLSGKVDNSNHTTFATLFLDGKVPFGEMLHYPLTYQPNVHAYDLQDSNQTPFSFYLTAGSHSLTFKIDQSLYQEKIDFLAQSIDDLNTIYLGLKRIAGTVNDAAREWSPEKDFPGVVEKLKDIVSSLQKAKKEIYLINGATTDFTATIDIQSVITALEGILAKPQYIPNKYAEFSEGGSSIIASLASAKSDLQSSPLEIDRILIGPADGKALMSYQSGWFSFSEHLKKFFSTFFKDYSMTSKNKKTIQVWVARSRQYVDLMQQLMDESDFAARTGYQVQFTILSDEGKLILSNAAKISPNAVMGISNWLPYEMGIRGLTVDLTQYEDYGEVLKRFSPGSLINLISDNRGLGLPETQDFYVMYYRKDILDRYGFSLPETWEDVINLLPKLERNGMNFYIPLSTSTASKSIMTTAPFIFQYGGNLFSEDGTKTTIDEESSLNAIKMMTELYTLYGMESQVSNFFDSFRNGSLPIGVSTFDTYVRLSIAAPEISGKWKIALAPGVRQSDGSIARWQTGSSTSMSLLPSGDSTKDKAGWELLKWWSSEDVQKEFASKLSLLYGQGYIWNSANLNAFQDSIIFTAQEKETILSQWNWLREIPKVPGWYMLERELSNSWNSIVLDAKNTRQVISDAVTIINKEITKKLIEFGYLDSQGNELKPYHMTTFDTVQTFEKG